MKQLKSFTWFASLKTGRSKFRITADVLNSVFKYNISLKDYFYFRFFEKRSDERYKWAGTGYMYEYQLKMNPRSTRKFLEDKIMFLNNYRIFIKREFYTLDEIKVNIEIGEKILGNSTGRMVLKNSHGQVGAQVEVISCKEFTPLKLMDYMKKHGYDLVEEYVIQHKLLMELSPSGLNTVRIFTQLSDDDVHFLGARLRVSVNSPVDNLGAGNLAAPVDIRTGIVTDAAVYSDITKSDQETHPVTGKSIKGFQIPYWNEVIELARSAAVFKPENRSIGWDIAITEKGPEIIEGNHNWCKLLWQLPVKKGLKNELEKFL